MTKTNYWLERVVTKINKKSDRSTISEDIKTLTFRSYLQFIILCVVIAVLNSGTIYVAKLLNHKMLIMQSTISAIPISSCDNISNKDILQDCLKSGADKADMRASKEYFSYYKNSIRASMPIIPSNKVMADFKVATQEFKEYVDNKHTEQFMSIGVNDGLTELLSLKHNLSIPYEIFITALWALILIWFTSSALTPVINYLFVAKTEQRRKYVMSHQIFLLMLLHPFFLMIWFFALQT